MDRNQTPVTGHRSLVTAAALALALLGGCSSTTLQPAELVEFKATAELKVSWQGSVSSAERGMFFPALSSSTLYAGGVEGDVTAYDITTGRTQVQLTAEDRVSGGVGVGSGLVLLGTPKGEVLAFDGTGKLAWKAQLTSEVLAPPAAEDGMVVARTVDGRIHGLDAADGKSRWVYYRAPPALSLRTHAGVLVERGAVFAGLPAGRLVALTLNEGRVGWEAVVALPRGTTELERVVDVASLPAIDGQRVCAAAYQGRVACFDPVRGALLWARDISSIVGIAMDDAYLYVTDDRNNVLALDKTSGASIWRQDKLAGRSVSAPLALGRYVAVGDFEGYVHLLSTQDGSFAARIETDGSGIGAPPRAISESAFVVQTRDGGVFAITVK